MTQIRLASAQEARTILGAEDDFTRALGSFDRSFRMSTKEPVTDAELRSFFADQARDFTTDEAKIWESALEAAAEGARGIGRRLPEEVLVIKTTGNEERHHAYTRANAIILPASRVESWRGERAIYLIAHELFHVASRASPSLRDATYALLGFDPIPAIAPPEELDDRRLTNPDAYRFAHFVRLGERAVIPLLASSLPLTQAIERASLFDAVGVSLLQIDAESHAVLRHADGQPILVDPSSTEWPRQLAKNTKYTIHPEEVLADNHALLVRRRLGISAAIADPAFLEAFEAAILD